MKEESKKEITKKYIKDLYGLYDEPKPKYKPKEREFIYIKIDRKYLGMTQKERDAAKKAESMEYKVKK